MKLTVEIEKGDNPEVALCFDQEGLDLLIKKLVYLRDHIDHLHLMTPSWAGHDLSEELEGGDNYQLGHSLRLVRLPNLPTN